MQCLSHVQWPQFVIKVQVTEFLLQSVYCFSQVQMQYFLSEYNLLLLPVATKCCLSIKPNSVAFTTKPNDNSLAINLNQQVLSAAQSVVQHFSECLFLLHVFCHLKPFSCFTGKLPTEKELNLEHWTPLKHCVLILHCAFNLLTLQSCKYHFPIGQQETSVKLYQFGLQLATEKDTILVNFSW